MKQFLINFCSMIFDLFVIVNTAIIWNITIFSIALGEVIMFNSTLQLVIANIYTLILLVLMVFKNKKLWLY